MPQLFITKNHNLGAAEAKDRIDRLLARTSLRGEISNVNWSWNGYLASVSFTMYGTSFHANLSVAENTVTISAQLPLLALPFKGRIESTIGVELDQTLA
jgi:hypothetical protein